LGGRHLGARPPRLQSIEKGRGVQQEVCFCTAPDGLRLAYALHGSGPPLVRVATWLTHLGLDWESPVWRHWLDRLGECHTVVRYDERGCGLSDARVGELSLETWVADLRGAPATVSALRQRRTRQPESSALEQDQARLSMTVSRAEWPPLAGCRGR
jgi:hypothetical protein